ncbi:MAG TPA: phosphoenolpyruvate carboxykinase domain-containing protein, partial [Caulobacteraceae bacterium]|nr:phosphoenolpyruvate carboxykinase domain-containing protein [Caulobacteraceae bacterium]
PAKLPRIYSVNWFRKDAAGKFVWPGFGENARVLKWIVGRLEGEAAAVDTPIGRVPADGSLDLDGLTLAAEAVELLRGVDLAAWRDEAAMIPAFYERFGDHLPAALWDEYRALVERLAEQDVAAPPKLALSA